MNKHESFARAMKLTGLATVIALAAALVGQVPAGAAAPALAAPAVAAPALAAPAVAAAAQLTSFDTQMITLVNQARTTAGAPQLTQATGLTQLAVWWSAQMSGGATGYSLEHNPNAWTMVTTYGAANRTTWGENVAWSSSTATTAQQIFTAYMNSPGHKANILSRNYHFIGMGTVSGAHGLYNTTEFTDAVQVGQAVVPVVYSIPKNGDFFRDATTNVTYRLVGGGPVYVSSWAPFGGAKPVKLVAHSVVVGMATYPLDGTFLRTAGIGQVFRVTGGAPVYVSSWAPFGRIQPFTDVDPAAIAYAGAAGVWSHLRSVPADGTFVRTPADGAVYRFAGGAPLWITDWAPLGGPRPTQVIDPAAIAHGGLGSVWSHVRWYPADNTYLQGAGQPSIYRVTNGRATVVPSWASVGGPKPFTVVSVSDLRLAGIGGRFTHLKK